jgi:hypothetical protein
MVLSMSLGTYTRSQFQHSDQERPSPRQSFLVRIRTDPKTVQTLLRHSDVKLTLQSYSHAVSQDRMAAAREMLMARWRFPVTRRIRADWERTE